MSDPDIALAASAREWPDRLHRHLLDHGGGRVTTRIMGPEQAIEHQYDVLFIDDVCSFLTPRLVTSVKKSGAQVVGVFLPADGSDAKRRLLECGINDVVESEASAPQLIDKARAAVAHRLAVVEEDPERGTRALTIGVSGSAGGVGTTELAVHIASMLASSTSVALVDADPHAPSIAQRLDVPLHPNLRTVLDSAQHEESAVAPAHHLTTGLAVVAGAGQSPTMSPLGRVELSTVITTVQQGSDVVVVDLGSIERIPPGVVREFETLTLIGSADPVGITRLVKAAEDLRGRLGREDNFLLVVNRAPAGSYLQAEIRAEVGRVFPDSPLVLLRDDPRVTRSAWEGATSSRGPYAREIRRMAGLIEEAIDDG